MFPWAPAPTRASSEVLAMKILRARITACTSGQALVEAAIFVPFLLTLIFNIVNFGYFFLVALNVASAPRVGADLRRRGTLDSRWGSLARRRSYHQHTSVAYLVYQDMTGAIYSPSTNAAVQVCSQAIGLNNPGRDPVLPSASTYNSYSSPPSPASDPESPYFVLQRVDVSYQFTPLIPGTPFGLALLPASSVPRAADRNLHLSSAGFHAGDGLRRVQRRAAAYENKQRRSTGSAADRGYAVVEFVDDCVRHVRYLLGF